MKKMKYFFIKSPFLLICGLVLLSFFLTACSELEQPKPAPFYAETAPPRKQEFRWSNGKTPKSFDPALAAAPPETDIIRAIYDGLTDMNPSDLTPVPAIASNWEASEDNKIWTFHLRTNAKWSNGETVTADDFVRSWKRLAKMGEKVSHHQLLNNIVGVNGGKSADDLKKDADENAFSQQLTKNQDLPNVIEQTNSNLVNPPKKTEAKPLEPIKKTLADEKKDAEKPQKFGVEAIDDYTLEVTLKRPDKDFPVLVAHPIFRPVYLDGEEFEAKELNADIVTNGAFRIFSVGRDGITLDRADFYWNKEKIKLERVRFVPTENGEKALEAYRAGEVDAVTNQEFEPLALKLLKPFDDFNTTTHSAINFYEFNRKKAPFNDRRVREALAISIDRERLTEGDMEGATKPALSFLPFDEKRETKISQDNVRAGRLLKDAGFPNGENFPAFKLLINRNNIQQRIARSVAKMWKDNLNIETEIVVKEPEELETAQKTGDFDMIRRGVVLPTTDETASLMAMFPPKPKLVAENAEKEIAKKQDEDANKTKESVNAENTANNSGISAKKTAEGAASEAKKADDLSAENSETAEELNDFNLILTEKEAIFELPGIPLYFPTSYSLVKPYVLGFNTNSLDAPSLRDVMIDSFWQPKKEDKKL